MRSTALKFWVARNTQSFQIELKRNVPDRRAITRGEFGDQDCRPEHSAALIAKLREVGVDLEELIKARCGLA